MDKKEVYETFSAYKDVSEKMEIFHGSEVVYEVEFLPLYYENDDPERGRNDEYEVYFSMSDFSPLFSIAWGVFDKHIDLNFIENQRDKCTRDGFEVYDSNYYRRSEIEGIIKDLRRMNECLKYDINDQIIDYVKKRILEYVDDHRFYYDDNWVKMEDGVYQDIKYYFCMVLVVSAMNLEFLLERYPAADVFLIVGP